MKLFKTAVIAAISLTSFSTLSVEWTVSGSSHPLFDSLKVKAQTVGHPFLKVEKKTVGVVECVKTTLEATAYHETTQGQITCTFPEKFSSPEAQELFENLEATSNDTTGAYTEYKLVGKMFVVGSDDSEEGARFGRVFFNHPCNKVYSEKQASQCLDFYATKILPSFESPNSSAVVKTNKARINHALESMKIFGSRLGSLSESRKKLTKTPFLGMMVEHIYAGRHFSYFSIERGENVLPKEIMNFNMEDIGYDLEDLVEEMTPSEKEEFKSQFLKNLYLGEKSSLFPELAYEINDGFDYL